MQSYPVQKEPQGTCHDVREAKARQIGPCVQAEKYSSPHTGSIPVTCVLLSLSMKEQSKERDLKWVQYLVPLMLSPT